MPQIIWQGCPRPGMYPTDGDVMLCGAVSTGYLAALWVTSRERIDATGITLLTAIWLFLTIGRLVIDAMIRAPLIYTLTASSLIIADKETGEILREFPVAELSNAHASGPSIIGDVHLGTEGIAGEVFNNWKQIFPSSDRNRLRLVEGAQQLAKLVRQAAEFPNRSD